MVIALRRLIACALALAIGLAIAPHDAPTRDHSRWVAPSPTFALGFVDWTVDAPDFVAPDEVAMPAKIVTIHVIDNPLAPVVDLRAHDVLRVAPKTSPPA
jgi:hypothetical protein